MLISSRFFTRLTTALVGVATLLTLGLASSAQAQNLGLGIILGDPIGLTAKGKLNQGYLDGIFAYSSGPASTYYLAVSYQLEKPRINTIEGQALDLYYGIGIRLYEGGPRWKRRTHIGPKVPIGISTKFRDPSIEVYFEASVIMDITPATEGDVDAGIGVRYWF